MPEFPRQAVAVLETLFSLREKIAVVLGGATGLGKSIAVGLATAGADVVVSSRRLELVEATANELRELGSRTLVMTSDVQSYQSLLALSETVTREFEKVDILVVASGVISKIPSAQIEEPEYLRIIDTNLNGTFRANQIFGRIMIQQRGGSIINIASIAGLRGFLEMPHYTASKAGVIGLTKTLACEWAPYSVRVNAIAPGPFKTRINAELLEIPGRKEHVLSKVPMKRFGNLTEVAAAAIYLASDAAGYVSGIALPVDGGFLASGL